MNLGRPAPFAFLFVIVVCAGCAISTPHWHASAYRAGDEIFRSDPHWLGADAAYSVLLDGDRTLWLFGDTFIGDGTSKRRDAAFVRNSIALQVGLDVRHATLSFHWGGTPGAPDSYFPATEDAWLWPLHGIYRDGTLTLFFMRVVSAEGGLGFALAGSAALRCDDISGPPELWKFVTLPLPEPPGNLDLLFGEAVCEDDGFIYAYCAEAGGTHKTYLLRWTGMDFDRSRMPAAQWWDGRAWTYSPQLERGAAPVFSDGATEFSVHRRNDGRYLQVQSDGFPQSDIAVRTAPRPEGPWSRLKRVYHPRESSRPNTLVYAAKAHPELLCRDLLVTYAVNHFNPDVLLSDNSLYFPRFVRLQPVD